ncbi:MAG: zinc-finger domain-containing protein [Halothiobacillaceae bacterium]|nr:zinc-finger domain-containing protein [Halothiobacillaceae bacterium]
MTNPNTAQTPEAFAAPASETVVRLTRRDLPVHCPVPNASLWNAHPRVYIPVEENGGQARCIYCSTLYVLDDV